MEPPCCQALYRSSHWVSEERWNWSGGGLKKDAKSVLKKNRGKKGNRKEIRELKAKAMNFIDNWQITQDSRSNAYLTAVSVNVLLILNLALICV